jgi:hypothetical protein
VVTALTPSRIPKVSEFSSKSILSLSRHVGRSSPSSRHLHDVIAPSTSIITLEDVDMVSVFIATVTIGNKQHQAIIDTGSSDTWFVTTGFTCLNYTDGTTVSEADCAFGSPITVPANFVAIKNEHLNITYGTGAEYIFELPGNTSFTIGGIRIPAQEINLVNIAAWNGDVSPTLIP